MVIFFDLPTLEFFRASTCLSADPKLLPVRESGREAVLRSAHYVLGLSSFVGMSHLAYLLESLRNLEVANFCK
jgi:hypothetical protein